MYMIVKMKCLICDDAVLTKLASNDNAKEADKPDTNVWQNLKGLIEDN